MPSNPDTSADSIEYGEHESSCDGAVGLLAVCLTQYSCSVD